MSSGVIAAPCVVIPSIGTGAIPRSSCGIDPTWVQDMITWRTVVR
jgi:hypothetical protein